MKNKDKFKNNCSLIVSSCDAYQDLWRPFVNTFEKYWPDCNLKRYFITENKDLFCKEFHTIKCGLNKNWSDRLLFALKYIDSEYIILFLEDFFLKSKIENSKVNFFIKYIQINNLNFIRLIKRPNGNKESYDHPLLTEIENFSSFRVSTQVGIWKKKILINLIKKNENIWEFELNGTNRSNSLNNFFCVKENVMTYKHHVVERGKWFPWSAFYYRYIEKVDIDLNKRKIMNLFESIKWIVNKLFAKLFSKFPYFLKKPLKCIAVKLNLYA